MEQRSEYTFISNDAVHHSDSVPGGSIDLIDENGIRGWCVDPTSPSQPVTLSVNISDFTLAEIATEETRDDIARHFNSTTSCGFNFAFDRIDPERGNLALEKLERTLVENPGDTANIRVFISNTEYELPRWQRAGSGFCNINLLYVLRSSSSNSNVGAPALPKQDGFAKRPIFGSGEAEHIPVNIKDLLKWIGQTNEYHYLSGIELFFEHNSLGETEALEAVSLAIASEDANLITRFVTAAASSGKVDAVPIRLLTQISGLLLTNREARDTARMSPDVLIGSINIYKDINRRQRSLIDALIARLSKS